VIVGNHIWSGDLKHRQLLLLSLASALLSYLGVRFQSAGCPRTLEYILFYSPGIFFGALVLVPMPSEGSGVWWRRIRLVIASVLIWHIALRVAIGSWPNKLVGIVSYTSAGMLGALMIVFACRFIIPQRFSLRQIMMASLAGVVGGASFGIVAENWVPSWLGHPGFVIGFIIWQMGVAFALFSGYFLGSEASSEPAQEPRI